MGRQRFSEFSNPLLPRRKLWFGPRRAPATVNIERPFRVCRSSLLPGHATAYALHYLGYGGPNCGTHLFELWPYCL